ncbi:NADH dehydrogenase (quinone) [Flexistipes sinusarabici DSM 4947]|uniref:NADH dehydrogenase (Quinone) n=1 Tax=Flexistipes sinusarabici (strain ATCC 49648 / DSM 4947 / MAS 10) TaxID=717231 RepID=F8E679_FLESM|nr:Na(+)/H(+) antiporter subunit D [Flexistipes sinusarabici]AEI15846.1 NADH dehydrogenase (quinone) [Flexistipes sinusarabici DSM 4947]
MINVLPPAFIFIISGLIVPFLKGRARNVFLTAVPIVTFINLITLPEGISMGYSYFSYNMHLLRVDELSLIFGYIFLIISFASFIYGYHVKNNWEFTAGLFYAGGALGVIFAADLVTLYFFWELMTVASVFLIWARNTDRSIGSGMRYFLFHLVGGVILLIGIILQIKQTGSAAFNHMELSSLSTYLIFIGFGINCAWPLLHTWLVDAYPEATILGTVLLSTFTTKTAIYTLVRGFAGTEILIFIGAAMAAFPIFYAVIENDLRRVLAYSLINQLGFMVVGIGIGTPLALNGTVAHVFADILFKSLLFMGMGAVLYRTGKIKATEIGGLYKYMPYTAAFTIVGAASISAFPLFSAFATKSMVMSATAGNHYTMTWLILLFASAGVFHHAGIKIPFFAFFSHDSGLRPKEAPLSMLIGMGILAFLNIFIGIFPGFLYQILPFDANYVPYTTAHVVSQLQLLLFSALAFTLLLRSGIYPPEIRSVNLDADLVYRKVLGGFIKFEDKIILPALDNVKYLFFNFMPSLLGTLTSNPYKLVNQIITGGVKEEKRGSEAESYFWLIGWSVFIITVFLAIYLLAFMHF